MRNVVTQLVLASSVTAACGGGADRAPTVSVRDSMGVEIIESAGPHWAEGARWAVSAEPTLSIGVLDGPEELQFSQIPSTFFIPDGRIVVANARHPPELRVFDPDGAHRVSMGGAGGGPGEFTAVQWSLLMGDSVVAFDLGSPRLTFFSPDGDLLGSTPVRIPASTSLSSIPYVIWTRLADGALLISENQVVPPDARGRGRATLALMRTTTEGATPDTLLLIPGAEYAEGAGGRPALPPFGLRWAFSAAGERIFVGAGDELRIDVHDLRGRLVRSIRAAHERRPVTDASLAAMLDDRLERARTPEQRGQIQASFAAVPPADRMPAHGARILLDALDHLWIEAYHAPGDPAREWHVFDPEGRYLGVIGVPRDLVVMDVSADGVLGVWTDELDVPSVRRYTLTRNATRR
jgi:hypothetical protein